MSRPVSLDVEGDEPHFCRGTWALLWACGVWCARAADADHALRRERQCPRTRAAPPSYGSAYYL